MDSYREITSKLKATCLSLHGRVEPRRPRLRKSEPPGEIIGFDSAKVRP